MGGIERKGIVVNLIKPHYRHIWNSYTIKMMLVDVREREWGEEMWGDWLMGTKSQLVERNKFSCSTILNHDYC